MPEPQDNTKETQEPELKELPPGALPMGILCTTVARLTDAKAIVIITDDGDAESAVDIGVAFSQDCTTEVRERMIAALRSVADRLDNERERLDKMQAKVKEKHEEMVAMREAEDAPKH